MKPTKVISIFMLLFFSGVTVSSKVQAGKSNSETAISLPPGLPENINSQQESFPVCKYPLFLVNKLRETIGNRLSANTSAKPEPDNYPWAIKPTRSFCTRPGCSGVVHRHREPLRVAILSAGMISAIGGVCFSGVAFVSALALDSGPLFGGFFAGGGFGLIGGCLGVVGLLVTAPPAGKLASRLYQCNHEQCVEVPRLQSDDVIDEHLRCPGNNEFLLRHPVMISRYEQPLSLEFVMQCIRDKTPFPQDTSAPVEPDRIIKWGKLTSEQQKRVREVYEGSQEWLRQSRPQDLKAISMNEGP